MNNVMPTQPGTETPCRTHKAKSKNKAMSKTQIKSPQGVIILEGYIYRNNIRWNPCLANASSHTLTSLDQTTICGKSCDFLPSVSLVSALSFFIGLCCMFFSLPFHADILLLSLKRLAAGRKDRGQLSYSFNASTNANESHMLRQDTASEYQSHCLQCWLYCFTREWTKASTCFFLPSELSCSMKN